VGEDVAGHAVRVVAVLSLGYSVTAASNAVDALQLLQDQAFDFLFTDVVLPKGMSGVELARRAQALKPEIKIL
jgi:CheY-like chemotaxis protein